jgi:hypothetical protein
MTASNDNAALMTTAEAAAYLRFQTASAIRSAVMRGELRPVGAGPKGSHLFTMEELHRFVEARAQRYCYSACLMRGFAAA